MKAFFAAGAGSAAVKMLSGHNALVSFAMIGTWIKMDHVKALHAAGGSMFLDSGAFSACGWSAPVPQQ